MSQDCGLFLRQEKDHIVQKTETVEAQVEDVKQVMDKNINDMIERGEKLEDLEKQTGKF